MRAIRIEKFVKSHNELRISDNPPDLRIHADDEVVVDIRAVAVNYVDLLYARGKHQNNRRDVIPPFTLGLEFAGTVAEHGSASSGLRRGDRVFGASLGAFADRVAIKASALHRIPQSWTFEDAAGIGATAPVSYGALIARAKLQPGETVLVHGAAGGLGLMAVQIAKVVGARVIATAGGRVKGEVARMFGADHVVDYKDQAWQKEVLQVTAGEGVDVVFDPVGLVGPSVSCLKEMGRVLIVGFAGRGPDEEAKIEEVAMNRFLLKQAVVMGYRWGATQRLNPKESEAVWRGLGDMLEKGLVKPTVYEKAYSGLEDLPRAMEDLANRQVWGKAVVKIRSSSRGASL